jgi:nucleoid-associated protein
VTAPGFKKPGILALLLKGEEALKTHHLDFKKDLMEYLTQQEDRKVSVKLSEIEKIARKYIPAEEPGQADALADRLISHLNSEECAVPVEFSVSKTELAKHRQIRYKADDWELNFERGALGESNDASVYYEREMNRLIINNLPDPMVKQIKDELEGRATG